jgi:hypothetical protein
LQDKTAKFRSVAGHSSNGEFTANVLPLEGFAFCNS